MAEIASFGVNVDQNTRLAQNAQDTANDANKKNSANSQQIANINDPNYLTPFEKPQLEIQMDNFATIYKTDKDIAEAEGIDFTAYDAAYQAYLAYMTPLIADMTKYSPIVRSTFNGMVTAVQAEQKRFNTATQAQYNQQIKKAQTDIGDGQAKYQALQSEAETMKSSVAGISDAADRAISSAGFASNAASTASQAANEASQAASSALASAINAQTDASSAVAQASSAATDSKDAKQIAGAVSQSYKTLTDGSTMTIAELQNGLAAKLTKTDLNGYATQDWTQNKIKLTSDGLNGTISSIKSTVDGHTTDINDLKADSHGFKEQFTTVNDTLGKQTTDIGSLQASSKELISNFDSLSTANGTNEHNIGELQQTSKEFNSTLMTVKTQVANSAVGTNLLMGTATPASITGNNSSNQTALTYTLVGGMSACALYQKYGSTFTLSYDWSVTDTANTYAGTMRQQFNNVPWGISDNSTISSSNKSGHKVTTLTLANNSANIATGLEFRLDNVPITSKITVSNMKLEKGSLATDWCPNPADTATVTALTKVKRTADSVQVLANNNKGDIAALTATAKGLQTTVSNNYSDLKSQVTQTDSAWRVALSNTGQTNLVYNSGYKNNGDGWNTLGRGYFSTVPVSMYEDSAGFGVSYSGRGNTWTEFGESKHLSLPTTTIDATNVMSFAGYIKLYAETAGGIGAQLCLAFYDTNGARVGYIGYTLNYTDTGGDQAWHYVKKENVPVPANAVTFGIQYWGYGDTVHAMFAHPMIVKASTVGPYVESTNDLATQSDITVLSNDINLRVKKGDVVNQFNIDAGGALLSTTGNSTKIVFSSPNIIFDSKNPVQIPNANIPGVLTSKTFEAGTITATTKIISSDIEASLVHSKDNSFSLNGATGDMIGASIHAADNSWGISNAGKIHGISVTASLLDISGDGTGPDYDKNTGHEASPDTSQGIYSRYSYSTTSGYDSKAFGRKIFKNGYLSISGDTFLNRAIVDWSADGGGVYSYDQMVQANALKMRAYNFTGTNSQTDNPSDTEGTLSSRIDITPSTISMGTNWSVSDPNVEISSNGAAVFNTVGTKNIVLNSAHTLEVSDGKDLYFSDSTGKQNFSLHAQRFIQSSLLSLKTDITAIDPHDALNEVVKNDVLSYHYKTDDPSKPKSVSVILDDINPIPEYYTSNIFKSADGTGRNDGNIVGYLMLSIKDLNSRLQKLEGAN